MEVPMDGAAVDRLMTILGDKAAALGLASLSEDELNVVLSWQARGVLGNGGFEFHFEGSHPLADVAKRFRTLGFERAADACDHVRSAVFPGGEEPADDKAREALAARVDWDLFTPQLDLVYETITWKDLRDAIARYVVAHPQAFALASA
jgi:hypothetical protein